MQLVAGWLVELQASGPDQVRRFARRLAGVRGDDAVVLAGGAIRGVALGVGGTAMVKSVLGGLGIAQIGPIPVLLGAAGWAIFLVVWAVVVGTLYNVLRPWLIKLGADLPLLLIFSGVIGGLFAFGLVGIFVGPVMLAVGDTLLDA